MIFGHASILNDNLRSQNMHNTAKFKYLIKSIRIDNKLERQRLTTMMIL